MPTIFGSLVLHANRQVSDLMLSELSHLHHTKGHHVSGRNNGGWHEATDVPQTESYLPQRYKHLSLLVTDERARLPLIAGLEQLDSMYVDARQLYKLNRLLNDTDYVTGDWSSVVNISSAVQDGSPVSGSFYLLSKGEPLYVALVFDVDENSVQLAWANFDFKHTMRAQGSLKYLFFPMPLLHNRPLFLHTQNLCARWWKLIKSFGTSSHGLLRACNALEVLLYKDPDVVSYAK